MILFALRRLGEAIAVLFVLSFLIYTIGSIVPGDIAQQMAGIEGATPERMAEMRQRLGLDRPLLVRYGEWLAAAVRGDFGDSLFTGRNIAADIRSQFPVSLEVAAVGVLLAVVIGIPLGVYAAVRTGSFIDRILRGASLVFFSVPTFVSGVLFVWLGSILLRSYYTSFYVPFTEDPAANLRSILLPCLAIALPTSAAVIQMTRTTMIASMQEPFIDTARVKGAREWRIRYIHALRASLGPVVTLIGLIFGALVGGLIIVEQIFNLPGLGQGVLLGIRQRDFPYVIAATLVIAAVYIVVNFLVDLLYPILDPRQREQT